MRELDMPINMQATISVVGYRAIDKYNLGHVSYLFILNKVKYMNWKFSF